MDEDAPQRRSRRGLWIRLAIYGPLILYFGWGAIQRYRAEQALMRAPTSVSGPTTEGDRQDPLEGLDAKRIDLPDGRSINVYEITPEQAAERGLILAPEPDKSESVQDDAK